MVRYLWEAMKPRLPPPPALAVAAILLGVGVVTGLVLARPSSSGLSNTACDGEYAGSLQAQSVKTRDIEQGPRALYTYLVRSSARYECPYFGSDGKLLRRRIDAVEHGTAFAYEVSNGETFLLTNEHVAAWPAVTDATHKVDGVHEGCKRVDEKLRIVRDEHDEFAPGHILLSRIAVDPLLDAAVLKASVVLGALPYRIGKSAALRLGDAVQVRGFPLGLIHAVNAGKVVNPRDRDQEQGWDHVDFVIDALLSEGNSGSPVLALSCRSGEIELVGMYHAGYKGASALNVVIGIDQLREFMAKKKRMPRATPETVAAASLADRKHLRERLPAVAAPMFDFGGLAVWATLAGDHVDLHLFGRGFPLDDRRLAVIEDAASTSSSGGWRLWARGDAGWRPWQDSALGTDERELVIHATDALRSHILRTLDYRRALDGQSSVEERRRGRDLLRNIERHTLPERELATAFIDLVERLAPARESGSVAFAGDADAGVVPSPSFHMRLDPR